MQQKKDIYKNQFQNPSEKEIKNASYSFAMFSANIKRYLPSIPVTNHIEMFKEVFYYQKISADEQSDHQYLKTNKIVNHSTVDLRNNIEKPTVFATFHLGSYRLLNSFLFEQGHKIVLIIDESVFVNQQQEMLRVCREVLIGKESSDMVILNVKDRVSIFKLKQLIEKGYIMTVYLDGNTGVNVRNQDFSKGYIPINFLESTMYVKNGVGKLAALVDAQLIPVVSYRDENDTNHMEFFKELNIDDFKDKQEFSVKTIEIAYNKLQEKLLKYPTQWECWLYIQKWFMRDFSTPFFSDIDILGSFNGDRYTTFQLGDVSFLFDMFDYKSYPIEDELVNAIKANSFKKIDSGLVLELEQKNIII